MSSYPLSERLFIHYLEGGGDKKMEIVHLLPRPFLLPRSIVAHSLNYTFIEQSHLKHILGYKVKNFSVGAVKSCKQEGFLVDKGGKLRRFDRKKLSRKRCGSLRGRGWKYGSGFVDGVFPILSPVAQKMLSFVQKETDPERVADVLGSLPSTHASWDDLINVVVLLRLNKKWEPIILVCDWILRRSSFQPDVVCFNLLIDAYGQKREYKKAESLYAELLESRCVPTEDTYALRVKAYCTAGLLEKAEVVFTEMRNHCVSPSVIVYNAYIDGLMKGKGNAEKAIDVFQRMKKERCLPTTETYNLMINLYGKAGKSYMSWKLFVEMTSHRCKPNICTYTTLINAFAREGLCEKAEEIFEQLQEAGLEPDVYVYNALMESYSRAGYPHGAAEIFSLMQHMGCEPDRASYNIMVDAYGRVGLHREAEVVFEEMKRLGITPTMKSHMLLLSAYSRAGDIPKCEDIVSQMSENGLKPDTFVLNSMLNLYGRQGQFNKMEEVLATLEDGPCAPDISTYNILINVYGKAGFLERMERLFRELKEKNLEPDVVTWTSRIGAYSRKKLYAKCLEIFEEMIDSGCVPDAGTAKVLLKACSNEEQVEQVTSVIRTIHRDVTMTMSTLVPSASNTRNGGVSGMIRLRSSSIKSVEVPRRMFLQLAGLGSVSTLLDLPGLAAPVPEMKEPELIRTLKLPSGVRIQEILEGEGPEAHEGDLVEVNYVCRRANGYFVHSTVDQFSGESSPVKLPLDEDQIIRGLKEVLVGMRVGGKRRALIPPSVGYINETLKPIPEEFGPRRSLLSHANESFVFEVQLLKVL